MLSLNSPSLPGICFSTLLLIVVGLALCIGLSMWRLNAPPSTKTGPIHTTYRHVNFGSDLTNAVSSESCSTNEVRRMTLLKNGNTAVRVVDGFLSSNECDKLISSAEINGFSRPDAFSASARACERLHTVDVAMSDEILKRLRAFLPEVVSIDGARWRLNRFTHHWRYVKYQKGGHFIPHFDGSKLLPSHEMSVFTVQIYLNDDFSGGATRFYMDYEPERHASHKIDYGHVTRFQPQGPPTHVVSPKTGSALVFNHASQSVLHDGADVEDGIKYILRGDILYSAIPEDIPILRNPTLPPNLRCWCPETAQKFGTRTFVGQVWWCECAEDGHGSECCGLGLSPSPDQSRQALSKQDSETASDGHRLDVILLSGKRASGKDFIGDVIQEELVSIGVTVHRAALGDVNKQAYAKAVRIDYERLMHDRAFKEQHRVAMVQHHVERNRADPEWCLKDVFEKAVASGCRVMLLTDLRTRQDLDWFRTRTREQGFALRVFRVDASDEARLGRGWDPSPVKDALISEVDLDAFAGWSAQIDNSAGAAVGKSVVEEWVRNSVMMRLPAAEELGWKGAAPR